MNIGATTATATVTATCVEMERKDKYKHHQEEKESLNMNSSNVKQMHHTVHHCSARCSTNTVTASPDETLHLDILEDSVVRRNSLHH